MLNEHQAVLLHVNKLVVGNLSSGSRVVLVVVVMSLRKCSMLLVPYMQWFAVPVPLIVLECLQPLLTILSLTDI